MKNKPVFILLLCLFLSGAGPVQQETGSFPSIPPFTKANRVLILAPHPDDEVIGCAGVIQKALKAKAQVRVTYLTNGEHNQLAFIVYEKRIPVRQGEFIHLGKVRRTESIASMKTLGLAEDKLTFFGYPDFGTFSMFSRYWQTSKPYKTILTRISSVPYKENFSYGAPYVGESILSDLKKILAEYRPDRIFVSHPADVNADHRALYLFLQIALSDLKEELAGVKVYPYLVHCVGWPMPRHYHPELGLIPPDKFLDSGLGWSSLGLSKEEVDKKHEAILKHKSQTQSSAFYLLSFVRKNELFSDYPQINLKSQDTFRGQPLQFSGFSDMFDVGEDYTDETSKPAPQDYTRVGFAVADKFLFIRIENKKNISKKSVFMLYLFGYNKETPFANMPKLSIFSKGKKLKVFDGAKGIDAAGFFVERELNSLTIKVPLESLGKPDYILASMKGYGGVLPVDALGFRKIIIERIR